MGDQDPVTQGMCNSARSSCRELRTLENQNLVLNLRAEITGMLDSTRKQIDQKFDQLLRDLGYAGETPADTAVHANAHDHPVRREKDVTWRARAAGWIQKNAAWVLVTLLALVAGKELHPFATRIMEAITGALEAALKVTP